MSSIYAFILVFLGIAILALPVRHFVQRRFAVDLPLAEAMVLVAGLIGYLGFWALYLHPKLGLVLHTVLLALPLGVIAWRVFRWFRPRQEPVGAPSGAPIASPAGPTAPGRAGEIRALIAPIQLGFGFLALLAGFGNTSQPLEPNLLLSNDIRPSDNTLPREFAELLWSSEEGRLQGMSSTGWRNSDRPPLQAGLAAIVAGPSQILDQRVYFGIGAFCQVLAFLAVVGLRRRGQIEPAAGHLALGLIALSGLMFFYTIFTWPKLMAAGFVIVAASALHRLTGAEERPKATVRVDIAILMLAFAFAMLSHGAAVFSLVGFALVYGIRALRHRRAAVLLASIAFSVVLYLPWMAHQKLVDPPGDRLVKMHLAGQIPFEDLDESVSASTEIKRAYARLSAEEIARYKWQNLVRLTGYAEIDLAQDVAWKGIAGGPCEWELVPYALKHISYLFDPDPFRCDWWTLTTLRRVEQRDLLLPAVAVPLAFSALAVGLVLWRRRRAPAPEGATADGDPTFEVNLALAQAVGLVFWVLIMFGPAETRLTHASMALMVLLLVQMAALIARAPRWVGGACLAVMAADFAVTWVATLPECSSAACNFVAGSDSAVLLVIGCAALLLVAGRAIAARSSSAAARSDQDKAFTSSGDR